jgi:hypothetical protein
MLCALSAVGMEFVWYSVMGKPRCRRKGTDLIYRVISTEQGKPVSLLERGSEAARPIDGDAGIGNEKKRRLLVIGQIEVASPPWDNSTSPETEPTSRWCSNSRPFEEPRNEAKQMTTVQTVGAASHTSFGFFHRRVTRPQISIE